jgi:hypothetical protein
MESGHSTIITRVNRANAVRFRQRARSPFSLRRHIWTRLGCQWDKSGRISGPDPSTCLCRLDSRPSSSFVAPSSTPAPSSRTLLPPRRAAYKHFEMNRGGVKTITPMHKSPLHKRTATCSHFGSRNGPLIDLKRI